MKEKGAGGRERERKGRERERKNEEGVERWWTRRKNKKKFPPTVGGCAEITVTGSITDDVISSRKICRDICLDGLGI